jgi:hypothetical protein
MKNEVLSPDKARLVQLEECEHRIMTAYRKGMEATEAIARELRTIDDQQLYLDKGCKTFHDYVLKYCRISVDTAQQMIAVSRTNDLLRKAGLPLPANQSQAAELARLEPEQQAIVWQRLLEGERQTEMPLTASIVKKQVELARSATPAPPRSGVNVTLDLDDGGGETKTKDNGAPKKMTPAAKVPAKVTFTSDGEAALERVRRLCGDPVGNAIANGNLPITERDLLKWSEEDDGMVETLAHYISNLRWTVTQALKFEAQTINEATTVGDLMKLAKARDGRYLFTTDYVKVAVELVA